MTTTRILMAVTQVWSDKTEKTSSARAEHADKCRALPPALLASTVAAVSARELRETPSAREQALEQLRTWLANNRDVTNVRLDDAFLLRFLRVKKFSVPMAQQTVLKYLNLRKYYPELSHGLDCDDTKLAQIVQAGYITISPVRDAQGRKVILYDMGAFDPSKFTCWDMSRAHILVYESLLEEEENQVLGFTHVGSGSGVTAAHITAWNPIHFARIMKWGEQSIPMRHKEVHLINVPASVKYVLDFACSKVSPKMVDRLHIHTTAKALHARVDPACLPVKYGGHVTNEEIFAHTTKLLRQHRQRVLALDTMTLHSTRGILSSKSKPVDMEGSFRKLEID